jgi:hypothetical protein
MIGTYLVHWLRHLLAVSWAHGLWIIWHMCMDILLRFGAWLMHLLGTGGDTCLVHG